MATDYNDAVSTIYRGPLDTFVVERKRLADELKTGGDKPGAARLSKLARPTMSAWAVNQLWWNERATFDNFLASAARVRDGDLSALAAHREATAALRARAATILEDAGRGAADATLRRVTVTLQALAAAGGFAPDPDGALTADRDAPGFGAAGFGVAPPLPTRRPDTSKVGTNTKAADRVVATTAADLAAAAAERARIEAERARQNAAREQRATARRALQQQQRIARSEVATAASEITRLRTAIADADDRLTQAQARSNEIDAQLAALTTEEDAH
jgi:hypothetical protein